MIMFASHMIASAQSDVDIEWYRGQMSREICYIDTIMTLWHVSLDNFFYQITLFEQFEQFEQFEIRKRREINAQVK